MNTFLRYRELYLQELKLGNTTETDFEVWLKDRMATLQRANVTVIY